MPSLLPSRRHIEMEWGPSEARGRAATGEKPQVLLDRPSGDKQASKSGCKAMAGWSGTWALQHVRTAMLRRQSGRSETLDPRPIETHLPG